MLLDTLTTTPTLLPQTPMLWRMGSKHMVLQFCTSSRSYQLMGRTVRSGPRLAAAAVVMACPTHL
eukprot:10590424-Prorocentrum_lima.AAC.1